MNLRNKFFLYFFFVSVIPSLVVSFYILNRVRGTFIAEHIEHVKVVAKSIGENLLAYAEWQKVRITDWSSDGQLRSLGESAINREGPEKIQELENYIKDNKQSLDPTIEVTDLLDLSGKVIVSTNPTRIGSMTQLTDLGVDASKKLKYGSAFIGRLNDSKETKHVDMIHAVSPLFSATSGRQYGYILNHVSLKSLNSVVTGTYLTQNKDGSGKTLATKLGDLTIYLLNGNKEVTAFFSDNAVTIGSKITSITGTSCDGSGQGYSGEYLDTDNNMVIGVSTCLDFIGGNKWTLIVEDDETGVLSQINNFYLPAIIILLICLLVVEIFAYYISNEITGRINADKKGIEEIGSGNFDYRINVIGNDAISEVGRGINKTAESLSTLHVELTESEEKYRLLVDSSPLCIKMFDTEGKLIFINKAGMTEHFLKTKEDVDNWNYMKSIDPAYVNALNKSIGVALSGMRSEIEYKHVPGTSQHEWCRGFFVPIKDNKGGITSVLFSSFDITEAKIFEERARRMEETKREFASIAAHQLLTPVTMIGGYTELLSGKLKNGCSMDDLHLFDSVRKGVEQVKELVNFLLKIARAESTGIKFNLAPISLDNLTSESIESVRGELDSRNQNVRVSKNPDPMPIVHMDYETLKQVIVNLLSNASRYSDKDQDISIDMNLKDSNVIYSVKDVGIGIPEAAKPRIFEKFFRADNAREKVSEGTGLGLSLAKSLVEAWGGKIWFESTEGQGSTFYITIPLLGRKESVKQGEIL